MWQSRAGCSFSKSSVVSLLILAALTVPDGQSVESSWESNQKLVGFACASKHFLERTALRSCRHLRGGGILEWDVVEEEYDYLAATTEKKGDPGDEEEDDDGESGEKESAAWIYETALNKDPTDPDALTALGRILEAEQKDFEGAERMYVAALQKYPTHRLALYNLSRLHSRVKRDQDASIELLQKAVESDPHFYPAVHQYARMLQSVRGECSEAERMYRMASALRPSSGPLLSDLGSLVQGSGRDPALALNLFKQAVRVSPRHPDALANLARALEDTPDYRPSESEALYRTALKADPAHIPSLCNLGLQLASAGRPSLSEAEALYRRALALNPAHVETLCNYGRLCHERSEVGQAEELFEQALRVQPDKVEGLNGKALAVEAGAAQRWSDLELGTEYDEDFERRVAYADSLFTKALALAPSDADTLCNRAALLHAHRGAAGRGEAEGLYRRVIVAEPAHAEALYNLAFLKQQEMEMEEAGALYQRAFELQPLRLQFRNALSQFSDNKYRDLLLTRDTRDPVDAVLRAKKKWREQAEADAKKTPAELLQDDSSSSLSESSDFPDP